MRLEMASILLSEADPDVRRLLVVLLERLGHEAIVLGGGLEVPPPADLLLLEPASPPHLEQARLARELNPSLPIVCVSMLPDDVRFPELGPLAYLAKPFALDELGSTIEAVLASACSSA
jgi:DNA-binding response OmpR family regulator